MKIRFLLVFFLFLFSLFFFYTFFLIFNLDDDKLHFGLVPINSPSAYRKIDFSSPYTEKVVVEVEASGTIEEFLQYEYKGEIFEDSFHFPLEAYENITIKVIFSLEDQELAVDDSYEGKIVFVVRRWGVMDDFFLWLRQKQDYYF